LYGLKLIEVLLSIGGKDFLENLSWKSLYDYWVPSKDKVVAVSDLKRN
jgi:hypothetical protein